MVESAATIEPLSSCILDISRSTESENRPGNYEVKRKTNSSADTQYRIQQMMKFHNCQSSKWHCKHHVYIIESLDYIKTLYVSYKFTWIKPEYKNFKNRASLPAFSYITTPFPMFVLSLDPEMQANSNFNILT